MNKWKKQRLLVLIKNIVKLNVSYLKKILQKYFLIILGKFWSLFLTNRCKSIPSLWTKIKAKRVKLYNSIWYDAIESTWCCSRCKVHTLRFQ